MNLQRSLVPMTFALRCVMVLSATALFGCTSMPTDPLPPVSGHGVTDTRADFAALFDQSLDRAQGVGVTRWLHGVEPVPSEARVLAATRRARATAKARGTVVLVVPGLFGGCVEDQAVPFGDGVMRTAQRSHDEAYRQYDDLGLRKVRSVELAGRGRAEDNGRRLAAAIRAQASEEGVEHIVLVSYSKGTTDALHALAHLRSTGGVPPQLKALVSVAGLVHGSALVERFEQVYEFLLPHHAMFGCSASPGDELADLTREARARWMAEHPLPQGLRYHSIVAHDDARGMAWPLRPFHAMLSTVDARNDGQTMAVNSLLPGSNLLAEVRADHWGVALPFDLHPSAYVRSLSSPTPFPRQTLFRAIVWSVLAELP
jgi:hypothetical protein